MARTRSLYRAIVATVAVAGVGCVFAADLPQLSGAANFRDIGGYQTTGGRKIKSRAIFRSGELSGLTTSDQRALESLQIRYEIDLRTDQERAEAPTRWGANAPEVIAISVGEPRNSNAARSAANSMSAIGNPADAERFMQQTTARIATEGAGDIGEVLRRLAQGDEPALIHCTAGKDRTGVTIAVLMTLLGVPRGEVEREYARSNEAVDQQIERMKARGDTASASGLLSLRPDVSRVVLGAKPGYLEAAFSEIEKQYGSFEAYSKTALKITPQQIQALRAKLLEP